MSDRREGTLQRESADASCDCKVGGVIEAYDLSWINDRLATRWVGDGTERDSLRDLTRFFNQTVLTVAMEDAGFDPLDGEVSHLYELLTDGGSRRMQVRASRRLDRAGIDVDRLTTDFVSHPTIGSHLKECLGVSPPTDDRDQVEKIEDRIFKMQNRAEAVIRGSIEQLRDDGAVTAGELDVFVGAQVRCVECGTQLDVGEFIREGGCRCDATE